MTDDARLVQQCLSGDEVALRALIERYQQIVFGLCYRMLGQREDAEDVAQEVFLRVFRSLRHWDHTRPLKPWVLTIATNRCRTWLERRARVPVAADFVEHLTVSREPAAGDVQAELAEELQLALETLREEYRLCFILFYQQNLSCAEIAETVGCPEGTVKTWLHRARRRLSEYLASRGFAQSPAPRVPQLAER